MVHTIARIRKAEAHGEAFEADWASLSATLFSSETHTPQATREREKARGLHQRLMGPPRRDPWPAWRAWFRLPASEARHAGHRT